MDVVLLEPKFAGNVGSVARAMKNFGFLNLVLVDPPVLGGEARAMAAGAGDVLGEAEVAAGAGVLERYGLVVGTSGIRAEGDRNPGRVPVHEPPELRERLEGREGEVALVFGREDRGLTAEQLDRCDLFTSIPTAEEYPVMNLSHAAAVLLYELSGLELEGVEMASGELVEALYRRAGEAVEGSGLPEHREEQAEEVLRSVIGRAVPTAREAHVLSGLFKEMGRER